MKEEGPDKRESETHLEPADIRENAESVGFEANQKQLLRMEVAECSLLMLCGDGTHF